MTLIKRENNKAVVYTLMVNVDFLDLKYPAVNVVRFKTDYFWKAVAMYLSLGDLGKSLCGVTVTFKSWKYSNLGQSIA